MLRVAMAWRQGQSYSEDLRARVLAAIDGGMAARAAACVFRVSVSYIYKAVIRRRRTGEVSASTRRGHRPRKLTPEQEAAVAAHIAAHPDITLAALQTLLHLDRQAVHAAPHVGVPDRQPHPHTGRNRDHRRDSALTTAAASSAGTDAGIRTRVLPANSISITGSA